MNKRLFLILPFFLMVMTGCETVSYSYAPSLQEAIYFWFERNFNEFSMDWGYSDSITEAPNGNKVHVYRRSRQVFETDYSYCGDNYIWVGGEYVQVRSHFCHKNRVAVRECTLYVEVDSFNIIKNIMWRGNGCDSRILSRQRY